MGLTVLGVTTVAFHSLILLSDYTIKKVKIQCWYSSKAKGSFVSRQSQTRLCAKPNIVPGNNSRMAPEFSADPAQMRAYSSQSSASTHERTHSHRGMTSRLRASDRGDDIETADIQYEG